MSHKVIDPDLDFLPYCSSESLDPLVKYLIQDKEGAPRFNEDLTKSDRYKRFAPNHQWYCEEIAMELQLNGGNSLINMFRDGGVPYREILTNVCDKMDVTYNDDHSTERIERDMFLKILTCSLDKMDKEERQKLVEELKLKTTDFSVPAVTAALQVAVRAGGFASYQVAVIVANAVAKALLGRGLSFAAGHTLTKYMGVAAGPVGWVLTGIWTLISVAGPAYRVTIPAVIQVAFLRADISGGLIGPDKGWVRQS